MPITLPPIPRIPRRRFLGGSLAACAGLLLGPRPWTRRALATEDAKASDAKADPNRFALLSDVHIAADLAAHERGVVMADHLKRAVEQVLRLDPRPAWVSVDGDCAYHLGLAGDYATLIGLLRPLREAGLPIHLTVGNHDNRDKFHEAFAAGESPLAPLVGKSPVEDRVAMRLESEHATWFVLDSLDKTNSTPGVVGEKQLAWLAGALDEQTGPSAKPALVMVHHNPEDPPKEKKQKPSGLIDTKALFDVLLPRKRVKALFYGHTHTWRLAERDGLHLVNFPAVAYPFKPEEPTGWVDGHLEADGMSLELRCMDPDHPKNGDKHRLTWRTERT